MGQFRRHFAILLGAIVVICCTIIGVRWSRLANRANLLGEDIPEVKYSTEASARENRQVDAGSVRPESSPDAEKSGASSLIDLNSASATELENLPGIGPVLARNIVEYREEHGPFGRVDDLDNVNGIGEKKLAALRGLVTTR